MKKPILIRFQTCNVDSLIFLCRKNGEVQTEKSIVDVLKSELEVGNIVNILEEAYLLYCRYAHAKRFSVRKGEQQYISHNNELQSKEFNCSCEGLKDEKDLVQVLYFIKSQSLELILKPNCRFQGKMGSMEGD